MTNDGFYMTGKKRSTVNKENIFENEDTFFIMMITTIIKAWSQLCWGQPHELCFVVPIYPETNPQNECTSSDPLLPSMTSLAYPFYL